MHLPRACVALAAFVATSCDASRPSSISFPVPPPSRVAAAAPVVPTPDDPPLLVPAARGEVARDQWSQAAAGDGDACRAQLADSGARFRRVADATAPNAHGCGVPHGVLLMQGPTGITYAPPLFVDCALALDLAAVEPLVQRAAEEQLGAPIVRIRTLGGYACRPRRGGWHPGMLSDHAFGVAADLAAFEPRRGPAAVVARDYERGADTPVKPRGRFLYDVFMALRRAPNVSHVLGPDFNDEHRDHFHVDRGLSPWRYEVR